MYPRHKNLKKEVLAFVSVSLVWALIAIVLSRPSFHDLMFKYIEWMEIFAAPLNALLITVKEVKGSKIFVLCLLPYSYLSTLRLVSYLL